jgi:hypothetical protein
MNAGANDHDTIISNLVKAINEHDLHLLFGLLSPHHKLTDSFGKTISGTDVVSAWTQCFVNYPEYKIEIEKLFVNNPMVALFGKARDAGRFSGLRPLSLLMEIKGQAIFTMSFYGADNIPFSLPACSAKEPFNVKVRGFV